MRRRLPSLLIVLALGLSSRAIAAPDDEAKLAAECSWLDRAIAREPTRDDSIMMYMRGMRPKCAALQEGLARKDGSITAATVTSILKEIKDLQDIVDPDWKAAHPNEVDPAAGPGPAERAATDQAAADKAAADKAAADKAAADKAAVDKAAADKAAAADQAAADRAASEKAAADRAEAERIAKLDAKERAKAEKERLAAEKKAALEAAKAEKERLAAEKKAAAQAERDRLAAEKAENERLAADKRSSEEAAQAERERVAAEEAEREQLARDLAEAERLAKQKDNGSVAVKGGDRKFDGTWEQPASKVLGKNVKRTLNLLSKSGKKVEGELYEEVWYPAPSAWIDRSCNGNSTFRMVTTARVSGTIDGRRVELRRDAPRMLACTCSSRCTVENRSRGMDLELSSSGLALSDATGTFLKPGSATVAGAAGGDPSVGSAAATTIDFAGNWETSPFKAQDRKVTMRLELVEKDGKLTGTMTERSSQPLPLASWSDRFCGGSDKWEWVTQWSVEGKAPKGRKGSLTARDGQHILCTCPSKCQTPDKKRAVDLEVGPDGRSLVEDGHVYEHH